MISFVVIHYFLLIPHLPCFTEYTDDEAQIQKHSSVIVRRIPIGGVKPSGKTYIVYVYFTKCFLFYTSLEDICSEFTKSIVKPRHHLMVVVSLVFFCRNRSDTTVVGSSRPVCKTNPKINTHLSLFFLSPVLLPLITSLRTFCQIQFSCVYLLFTVCYICVESSISICDLMSLRGILRYYR